MKPDREHIHAHFGTHIDLLAERRFMDLIERAESFSGSPFTLCRCPSLGKDTINLTSSVRQTLSEARWIPDHGFVELSALAPASGNWFSITMKIPLDPGLLSEVSYRLDSFWGAAPALEKAVEFLKRVAIELNVEYGYAHSALDEQLQDTFDPAHYRSITGQEPPKIPIDPADNPGRTLRVGQHVFSCRWLNFFSRQLLKDKALGLIDPAPGNREWLTENLFFLRLYDDPMAYAQPENRQIHKEIRAWLGVDELAEAFKRHPLEPSPVVAEKAPTIVEQPSRQETSHPETSQASLQTPLFAWTRLYDAALSGLPFEVDFYLQQARRAPGKVLEVGIGTGRNTIPIAKAGLPVVGLETNAQLVAHLRGLLSEEPTLEDRVSIIQADVEGADLNNLGPFGAVFIPYRGLNRLATTASLRSVLERLSQHLLPGGILVFNTFYPKIDVSRSAALVELRHAEMLSKEQGTALVHDTQEVDPIRQRMRVYRRVIVSDAEGEVLAQRFYTLKLSYHYPSELSHLLELAGFQATFFGGFQNQPLEHPDQEVVVVAVKR